MPQQYIDFSFVKANASFEKVLAHYKLVVGTRSDTECSVLCPFHDECKPSCKIELERKIFHCFGCEAKGNVLEFVAHMEGNSGDLRAAALKLAGICNSGRCAAKRRRQIPCSGAERAKGSSDEENYL